jgi:hypothetical protein
MSDYGAITHLAGIDVTFENLIRQRCAWCGALIIDQDLTMIAVRTEDADFGFPVWGVGSFVEISDSTFPKMYSSVEPELAQDGVSVKVPENACMRLPAELTRSIAEGYVK